MGYGLHRFVADIQIDPNLICGVCAGVLEQPVLTPCGHTFCHGCLDRWLITRHADRSCPECRQTVHRDTVHPVRAIRGMIDSLQISCDHAGRGCREVLRVDQLSLHAARCDYAATHCAGCGESVNRSQLADHQATCREITPRRTPEKSQMEVLIDRANSLQVDVRRLRQELASVDEKNQLLESELMAGREQLRETLTVLESGHGRGVSRAIIRLSQLLAANLLDRPPHASEVESAYSAIAHAQENYTIGLQSAANREVSDRRDLTNLMRMLLSTALASAWFSGAKREQISQWMESVARCE